MTRPSISPADGPPPAERPRHYARWIATAVGAVVVAICIVLALTIRTDPTAAKHESLLLAKPAPSFDLPTLDGTQVSLASLSGKAVIVNFWNTWCIPCRQELPALKTFYANHAKDSDFAMVGIVRDDTNGQVRRYVKAEQMHWIIAFDPGSKAALDFATRGQPETFAISPAGQIVGFQFGPSGVPGLDAMLARARRQN